MWNDGEQVEHSGSNSGALDLEQPTSGDQMRRSLQPNSSAISGAPMHRDGPGSTVSGGVDNVLD